MYNILNFVENISIFYRSKKMSGMGIQDMSYKGIQIGAGMTLHLYRQIFQPYVYICFQNLSINLLKNHQFFQAKLITQKVS